MRKAFLSRPVFTLGQARLFPIIAKKNDSRQTDRRQVDRSKISTEAATSEAHIIFIGSALSETRQVEV